MWKGHHPYRKQECAHLSVNMVAKNILTNPIVKYLLPLLFLKSIRLIDVVRGRWALYSAQVFDPSVNISHLKCMDKKNIFPPK